MCTVAPLLINELPRRSLQYDNATQTCQKHDQSHGSLHVHSTILRSIMADPLGTTVTAIQVLREIASFLRTATTAEAECKQLEIQVSSVRDTLSDFQERYKANADVPIGIGRLFEPDATVSQLLKILKEVLDRLRKVSKPAIDSELHEGNVLDKAKRQMHKATWPFRKDEILEKIQVMQRHMTTIRDAISLKTDAGVESIVESGIDQRKRTKLEHLLKWLSPEDFATRAASVLEALEDSAQATTDWFLQDTRYLDWKSGAPGALLVCHGGPGSGKSVLAASAFSDLDSAGKGTPLIAQCSFDLPPQEQIARYILAGILKQVVKAKGEASAEVEKLHDACVHRHMTSQPTLDETCRILNAELISFDRSYLIIDALDEIQDSTQRDVLLDALRRLPEQVSLMLTFRENVAIQNWFTHGSQSGRLRVLVEDMFEVAAPQIVMEHYVRHRVEKTPSIKRVVQMGHDPQAEIDMVVNQVVARTKTIFLLAKYIIEEASHCTSLGQLERCLTTLPFEIEKVYDRSVKRLSRVKSPEESHPLEVISLISCTKGSLPTSALAHAMTETRGRETFSARDVLNTELLLSACGGLVHVDSKNYTHLAHETLSQYISHSQDEHFIQRDTRLAQRCLYLLMLKDQDLASGALDGADRDSKLSDRTAKYPFQPYAASHWGVHARQGDESLLQPLLLEFLALEQNLAAAVQTMWQGNHGDSQNWDAETDVSPLHLAAWFGLDETVSALLGQDHDFNATDCLGTVPLMYAVARGHVSTVKLLLEYKPDASMSCKRGRTILHRATELEDDEIARLLLSSELDLSINAFDSVHEDMTALMWAIMKNNFGVFDEICKREDVDVNLCSPGLRGKEEPLHITLRERVKEIYLRLVRDERIVLLPHTLTCGVDSSETDTSFLEFLLQRDWSKDQKLRALGYCSLPAFRLLMAQTKSQATASDFWGILFGICAGNKHRKLECLLGEMESVNVKAENIVNMRDDHGETPLHTAAMAGTQSLRCIEILLANGARTDAINKARRTPLYYAMNPLDSGDPNNLVIIEAIQKAREREIQQELAQCLDMTRTRTLPGDDGPCFRQQIFTLGYKGILAALEHLGKEVSTRLLNEQVDVCGETPFILGVKCRDAKLISLLLEYGADPEVKTRFGQTALYVAAMVVNVEVVEVLLEAGARPDTDTDYGFDAVSASIEGFGKQGEGSPHIALLLIKHGAKLHDKSLGKLYRLLEWALDTGNVKVMQRLAEAGAPMELRDMNGVSPYQRARRAGHDEVALIIRNECQKRRGLRRAERELRMSPVNPSLSATSFHKSPFRITGSRKLPSGAPTTTSSHKVVLPAAPNKVTSMDQLRKVATDLLPGATCGNVVLVVVIVMLVVTNVCTLWIYSLLLAAAK